MRRITNWAVKNKQFYARFRCGRCDKLFQGRVQFKLKYEGVAVKKALTPYVEPKETEPTEEAGEEN